MATTTSASSMMTTMMKTTMMKTTVRRTLFPIAACTSRRLLATTSAPATAASDVRSDHVKIVEVGPRDGLQNEKTMVPTATKIELIDRLARAGLSVVEATSFVSPKWVPQMSDAVDVYTGITKLPGVSYPVLVPNAKGLASALAVGVKEIAVFAAASESFSQKNINCSIDVSLDRFKDVIEGATSCGVRVRGYVSTVIGCPYEGDVAPDAVARVAERLFAMGCYEISLGDTIGVGTPRKFASLIDAVEHVVPLSKIAVHCHDTYGQAIGNIVMSLEKGIRTIDSSIAGLGGCPYAKGATGNVATEDVVYLLHGQGMSTGIDFTNLARTGQFISDRLNRVNQSKAGLATIKKLEK